MDLSAKDVREVRFGTTRVRAGYDMGEVDEFLDRVEKAIAEYGASQQRSQDEADALRSQLLQVQRRLESVQGELEEVKANPPAEDLGSTGDTVVVETSDVETTAETPVVTGAEVAVDGVLSASVQVDELRRIRDDVRNMLEGQLALVDEVSLPESDS